MKQILKRAAIAGTGVLFAAGIAFAGGVNHGTGYGSENESSFDASNRTEVEVNNHADIDNEVDAWLNTGKNSASFNNACGCEGEGSENSDPSIVTGNASATVNVTNRANDATVSVSAPEMNMEKMEWGNQTTGANSENESRVRLENRTEVEVNNNADIDNNVDLNLNTGKNMANFNTGGEVNISTGSASANVTLSNTVNTANVTVK
jgi:hypothetical protein